MSQIGRVIEAIFEPEMTYERYADEVPGNLGHYGRIVTEEEFKSLRSKGDSARSGVQVRVTLPNWSPRFHAAAARRAFVEMRAAHDRLFNVLDAYLAWANGSAAARSQMAMLEDPAVSAKAGKQMELLHKVKSSRAWQRANLGNSIGAALELARMYERSPWSADSGNRSSPVYYDQQAEIIRYNDLINQREGLAIADAYDDSALASLLAEKARTNLEFASAVGAVQDFEERQVLLGFDFTARIVDAITDVFQNATEVVTVARAFWGMHELEKLSPSHRTVTQYGWFFGIGYAFWPPWMSLDAEDSVRYLLSDGVLDYLDKCEGWLASIERDLQEVEAGSTRTLVSFKLRFARTPDGSLRAVATVPGLSRYQEVGAIYLKGMPAGIPTVSFVRPEAKVAVVVNVNRQLVCIAELLQPEFGVISFGSDGGMAGEAPIFALEGDCLVCSHVGNQSIELVCRNDTQPDFEVDCILRVSGYNLTS